MFIGKVFGAYFSSKIFLATSKQPTKHEAPEQIMLFVAILRSFVHSQGTQKDKQRPASGQDAWPNI
jgi:hypothetical protein